MNASNVYAKGKSDGKPSTVNVTAYWNNGYGVTSGSATVSNGVNTEIKSNSGGNSITVNISW